MSRRSPNVSSVRNAAALRNHLIRILPLCTGRRLILRLVRIDGVRAHRGARPMRRLLIKKLRQCELSKLLLDL